MQASSHNIINLQVHAFQSGDINGFNYFFELNYAPVCYFAFSILKEQAIAEEITDDIFVKLWERHSLYNSPEAIKAFLYRSVKNAAVNILRKRKTQAALQEKVFYLADKEELSIEHHIIRAETLDMIFKSLSILPAKCRQVFTLFYMEGKTYEEIATELQMSINNVRNHKMRALSLLRGQLGNSLLAAGLIMLSKYYSVQA